MCVCVCSRRMSLTCWNRKSQIENGIGPLFSFSLSALCVCIMCYTLRGHFFPVDSATPKKKGGGHRMFCLWWHALYLHLQVLIISISAHTHAPHLPFFFLSLFTPETQILIRPQDSSKNSELTSIPFSLFFIPYGYVHPFSGFCRLMNSTTLCFSLNIFAL